MTVRVTGVGRMREALRVNNIDAEFTECRFCGALCHALSDQKVCGNRPLHLLNLPCRKVLEELADPDCKTCDGSGFAYRQEDRCPIEGWKMANKRACQVCFSGGNKDGE